MARKSTAPDSVETLDTGVLDGLIGYDVRRASLAMMAAFARNMAPLELGVALFTVLLLVSANPGVKASQLCALLDLHSSNLVGMIKLLGERGLLERRPHPGDERALGLYLTRQGEAFTAKAYEVAHASDVAVSARLSAEERATLARLLRKIYRG